MPDFPIWPQCNIGCVFCSNPVEGFRDTTDKYSYDKLERKLLEYKKGLPRFLKFDSVRDYFNLTGGEPTIHPDFLKLVALIRREFPGNLIRLLSNGRMFAYEDFARRTLGVAGRPFEVAVPMFGHDARSHEAISRAPGSFAQTTQGLKNLRKHLKPGQKVEIRVIVTRLQCRKLGELLAFLSRECAWVDRVVFLFEEMEGFAEQYKEVLKIPMSEAAAEIDKHHELLLKFKEIRLYHFALCTVPTRLWPRVWNTLADFKIDYLPQCGSCRYKAQCVGVHRSYAKHMGAPDIVPIREARPVVPSGEVYHPIEALEDKTVGR